jgi:hypothetical protein
MFELWFKVMARSFECKSGLGLQNPSKKNDNEDFHFKNLHDEKKNYH